MPFFDPQKMKTEIPEIDKSTNISVSVIASFNKAGDCKPLYFQYEEGDEKINIAVDRVLCTKPNSFFGKQYVCEITVNERQQVVNLFYFTDNQTWTLRL